MFVRDGSPICILNLYNSVKDVSLQEMMYYVEQLGENYVIAGDFNAHSSILYSEMNRSINSTGKSLEKLIQDHNVCLINPPNMYTYVDRRTGKKSCLDLCLTSSNIAMLTSIAPCVDVGSDHLVVRVQLDILLQRYRWLRPGRFRVSKDSLQKFGDHYVCVGLYLPTDLNTLVDDFMRRILDSAKVCFGVPSSGESKTAKRTPWWSEERHNAVALQCRAFSKLQKRPTLENLINFEKYSAKSKYIIKKTKKESMQSFVSSLSHNIPQGTMWKKIKAFKKSYSPPTYPLSENNVPILEPVDKANALNRQFLGRSGDAVDEHFRDVIEDCCLRVGNINPELIGEEEVVEILSKLADKAPGFDGVTNKMIKHCNQQYKEELLNIINQSFHVGEFPMAWKFGVILPLLKAEKPKQNCSSYRPITLLSCFGKLLERVVQRRLEVYVENHKLLSHCQYGFRPGKRHRGHSTAVETPN